MAEDMKSRLFAWILACVCGLYEIFLGKYIIEQIARGLTSFLPILDIGLTCVAVCVFVILFFITMGFFLVAVYGDDADKLF